MNLYDILACPICKGDLERSSAEALGCRGCGRRYPVEGGVPVLLPDVARDSVPHEQPLSVREGYDPWVHRMILQSLGDDQVVLDAGCGNLALDDPCVIRMDVSLTPYTDLVGDLHALPFKPGSLDFVFALAVFEHLRQPFVAAEQIQAALKPGGYVYAECNFVFPYHGYPYHFFNASLHGLRELFRGFRELRAGVAPFQMPSFALDNVLNEYLRHFQATTPDEARFVELVRELLSHPLRRYDAKFGPEADFRVAAGVYFAGIRQPHGDESTLPAAVIEAYARRPDLQARYPDPYDLTVPDNLMIWARGVGARENPAIAACFAAVEPFDKHGDGRPGARAVIRGYAPIPHPDVQRTTPDEKPEAAHTGLPAKFRRAGRALRAGGLPALAREIRRYLRWRYGLGAPGGDV